MAVGKGDEEVERRAPWGADSESVEEGAHGGGVGAGWRVPADLHRVGWRAVQGTQGPWSGGDEAREVRVQGLRLLGRPVPDRGERSASVFISPTTFNDELIVVALFNIVLPETFKLDKAVVFFDNFIEPPIG